MPTTAPPPKSASTFCADVAVAARAVVARRRCSPCRELGAGPRRAPIERASRALPSPPWPPLLAMRCSSPRRRPSAHRPSAPTTLQPPAPSWRVYAARPVACSALARAARRDGRASRVSIRDITPLALLISTPLPGSLCLVHRTCRSTHHRSTCTSRHTSPQVRNLTTQGRNHTGSNHTGPFLDGRSTPPGYSTATTQGLATQGPFSTVEVPRQGTRPQPPRV